MEIFELNPSSVESLASLFAALCPETVFEGNSMIAKGFFNQKMETAFLVRLQENYIAFILLSLRSDYVPGSLWSPIAYVEGVYVAPDYRTSGIGRMLIEKSVEWAKM